MIAGTHLAFASALYLGGAALFGYKPDWAGWALVSVAALLPDIDLPTSSLGRMLFWLSTRLEQRFGHPHAHSFPAGASGYRHAGGATGVLQAAVVLVRRGRLLEPFVERHGE